MFAQVRKEIESNPITVYHHAACLIYATAHNKQLLVNNIFMPSIDFYEYHKKQKAHGAICFAAHTHIPTQCF